MKRRKYGEFTQDTMIAIYTIFFLLSMMEKDAIRFGCGNPYKMMIHDMYTISVTELFIKQEQR